MSKPLRIAVTADLHWGPNPRGDLATRELVAYLRTNQPDLILLAGDIGAGNEFQPCLELFRDLGCHKAVVPGNHDIWVTPDDVRGDSLDVYRVHVPRACAATDFHYLDAGPLYLEDAGLAIVGTINWYDYSWSIEKLSQQLPDYEERLRTKVFSRGRHNDARFVRWPLDDGRFTAEVVGKLERDLNEALQKAERCIVVTHHPPFYELGFPRVGPLSIDAMLWDAFCGNRTMEELLTRHAARIDFVFCGHTHLARSATIKGIRGYNVGSDYHFKRLLLVQWPAGDVEERIFGNPDRHAGM